MKIKLLTLFLLIGSFQLLRAETITKTYYFGNPEIIEMGEYQAVNFSNLMLTSKAGEPAMPYQNVFLLLPPGEEAVSINIVGRNPIEIKLNKEIYPYQSSRPLSDKGKSIFVKNENIYKSTKAYPENMLGNLNTAFMNGYSFALSAFTPTAYHPLTNTLTYYSEVDITIETKSSNKAQNALKNLKQNAILKNAAKSLVQNHEMLAKYPKTNRTSDYYDVLIITSSSLESSFQVITNNYAQLGILSQLVTVEEISSIASGQDIQEKIRNYIISEYQNHDIRHVLLGGDVEHVPYRGFYCQVQSSSTYEDDGIPADLYYSALDGNWNTDGDNLWGEIGEDDLLPDISVARFPASNAADINNLAHKTFQYQTNPVLNELNTPLLAGEHLYDNPLTYGSDYLTLLKGYRTDNGYTTNGIPLTDAIDTLYEEYTSWGSTQLMGKLNTSNSGKGVSFLHHVGHANETYVMHFYNSDITNSNFSNIDGIINNYTLIYTHGCLCGSFDYNDCIAEKIVNLEKFAAAFVGNSRYGWFNEGQTEGPSQHLHREFVNAVYTLQKNSIGEAHMLSKVATAPWVNAPGQWEEGALRWCFYDCNVLSDPALRIYTKNPYSPDINVASTLNLGSSSITLNIDSSGVPMKDYRCAFIKDGIVLGNAYTDVNGDATIEFETPVTTVGYASVKVHGFNCLDSAEITVIPSNSAYVLLNIYQINDENNNIAENGETIHFDMNFKNLGLLDATGVIATLSSENQNIEIINGNLNIGNISAGDSLSFADIFEVEISENIDDQETVEFSIEFTGNTKETWTSNFEIVVNAPELEGYYSSADGENALEFVSDPETIAIIDESYEYLISVVASSGNNNGSLDPGETLNLNTKLMNLGHAIATNVSCNLTTTSPLITINNGNHYIGSIPTGDTIDEAFSISVSQDAIIGETVDFTFNFNNGNYSNVFTVYLKIGLLKEDFESGDFNSYNWEMGGNGAWEITTTNPYEGVYAAKSAPIDDDETAELNITLDVINSDSISFYHKVSSEDSWDFLKFYIDGNEEDEWSGEENWEKSTYMVSAGTHTFKWTYDKDGSMIGGSDCAWIDFIVFPAFSSKMRDEITINCPVKPEWLTFTDLGDGNASLSGTPSSNYYGNYDEVKITAESGTLYSEQTFMLLVGYEGIKVTETSNIKVYPNPAKDFVYININQQDKDNVSHIILLDSKGNMVQSVNLSTNSMGTQSIDVSNLSNGIYFIEIISGNSKITKKISIIK